MSRVLSAKDREDIVQILRNMKKHNLESLNAADVGWEKRVEERKRKHAIGKLKIEKELLEKERLEAQIKTLKDQVEKIEEKINSKMPLGKSEKGKYPYNSDQVSCPTKLSLCQAVFNAMEEVHDSEMSKDVTGKKALLINANHTEALKNLAKCSTREDLVKLKVLP